MRGGYFTFVDSDDYIAENMYSVLMQAAEEYDADIVACNHQWGDYELKGSNEVRILSGHDALKNMYTKRGEELDGFSVSPGDKIYRSKLKTIKYREDIFMAEDRDWIALVFYQASSAVKIDATLYYYCQNDGSIMHTKYNMKHCLGRAFCYERIAKICAEDGSGLAPLFCSTYVDSMINEYMCANRIEDRRTVKYCRKEIKRHMKAARAYKKYCTGRCAIKWKLWRISPILISVIGGLRNVKRNCSGV